ncbi:hypothetical protein KY290_031100 [Solanum tuberosum]|uniref:Uncharacterized protein n=1 Tax=Solanum tuberosum TaxID=4113 RepID=A0ABQ7U867_SOLTU|nr:hypothetical protein KY290_031100 [Solanum tuberosum]
MPITRRRTNQPPPNQNVQSEAQDESLSQTSPNPPSLEDLRREAAPQEPTINATEQGLRNAVQLLIGLAGGPGRAALARDRFENRLVGPGPVTSRGLGTG